MPNIYDIRRRGAVLFMIATVAVAAVFLLISDRLVDDLSKQERDRMQIWADATREIASANPSDNLDFLLSIIEGNNTIPVILVDNDDNILLPSTSFLIAIITKRGRGCGTPNSDAFKTFLNTL